MRFSAATAAASSAPSPSTAAAAAACFSESPISVRAFFGGCNCSCWYASAGRGCAASSPCSSPPPPSSPLNMQFEEVCCRCADKSGNTGMIGTMNGLRGSSGITGCRCCCCCCCTTAWFGSRIDTNGTRGDLRCARKAPAATARGSCVDKRSTMDVEGPYRGTVLSHELGRVFAEKRLVFF